MTDIYQQDKTLQRLLLRVNKLGKDAKPINDWYIFLKTDKSESLSTVRIIKMLINIEQCSDMVFNQYNKRLIEATAEDIKRLVIQINDSDKASLTKRDYRIAIKKFFTFAGKKESVDWIKTAVSARENKRKLPEDLLTDKELELLISKAQNSRDKTIISLLGDSGLRIGELLQLKIKDIYFDDYGAYIVIQEGKTGSRRVRLISSIHYLKNWIENHPKPDRDNWLFLSLDGKYELLKYDAVRRFLVRTVKASGIKKRVHAHLFRHTAATRAASFMTESEMKVHFGWTGNSDMASVYVHMSGEAVDNKLLSHYGLKKTEDEGRDTLTKCPKCSKLNPKTAKFCGNCSCILDPELINQSDSIQNKISRVKDYLFQSQEFENLLIKALEARFA